MPSNAAPDARRRAFDDFYESYLFGDDPDAEAPPEDELDVDALFSRCEATFQQQAESGCFEKLFGRDPAPPHRRTPGERKRVFAEARAKRKFFADLQKRDDVPVDLALASQLRRIGDYAKQTNMRSGSRMRSLYDRLCDGDYSDQHSQATGDVLLARILEVIGQFGEGENRFTLRVDQQVMLSYALGAILQFLYGDELEANRDRLLLKLGLDRIISDIILFAPRRVGKTTFVASFLATLLIAVPKIEIACMSLFMRMALKMKSLTIDFMNTHKEGRHLVNGAINNKDNFECFGDHPTHKKMLHVLPDSPNVRIFVFSFFFLFIFFFFQVAPSASAGKRDFSRFVPFSPSIRRQASCIPPPDGAARGWRGVWQPSWVRPCPQTRLRLPRIRGGSAPQRHPRPPRRCFRPPV